MIRYEGAKIFTQPPTKQVGQIGASSESANSKVDSQASQDKSERGEKTAENVRFGEAISEHGFGGETTSSSGQAHQAGSDRRTEDARHGDQTQSRRAQGYGPGSNIGA